MSRTEVQERILNTAVVLFAEKGYDAVSMDQIAESIGMKGPNLYKYFKGKAEIYEELHRLSDELYFQKMRMHKDSMIWIHNAEEFKTFCMSQINFTISNDQTRCMRKIYCMDSFKSKELKQMATFHTFESIKEQYIYIFNKLVEYGEIEATDTEMLSLQFFSPISMLIQICDREPEKQEEMIKTIEKYVDYFIDKTFKVKGEKEKNGSNL